MRITTAESEVQKMAIYREVRTEVYCDICGEQIVAFKDASKRAA